MRISEDILTGYAGLKVETLGEARGGDDRGGLGDGYGPVSGAATWTPAAGGLNGSNNSYPGTKGMPPSADSSDVQTLPMRWCIFVDILGFSQLWEAEQLKALHALRELMGAIHRIGTRVYPDEGERLFVHHMGDGFAIVSDFGEASFEWPLGIASALMRHMASTGTFAAAAVAEGHFSDITGCYPEEVMRNSDDGHVVPLNAGLMTVSRVMGTAFIRAYRLHDEAPSGPFVIVSEEHENRVPGGFEFRSAQDKGDSNLLSIDWIRAESPTVARIQSAASLRAPKAEELVQAIRSYCAECPSVHRKWSDHLHTLLSVDLKSD